MMKKVNKTQHAYNVIKARILDGTYAPGQRIILDQIAKEVGSSTIPVREAIRQLEADQLIEYRPNSGAIVQVIDETAYKETLQILAVLEGYATMLSVPHITSETIDELRRLNQEMKDCLANYELENLGTLNRQFHFTIFNLCPNKSLTAEIRQTWDRMDTVRRSGFTIFPQRAVYSVQEHDHLIELIAKQAPAENIETFARTHKLNTLKAFEERKKRSEKNR
jgi:DNA-binding GntR family transcriptional regulator